MADIRTPEVENLLKAFAGISDADTIYSFLEDLFTVREIKDISQRLAVAQYLSEGRSYNYIEAQTGASATTIARVSKCLSYGSGGYAAALDLLAKEESSQE